MSHPNAPAPGALLQALGLLLAAQFFFNCVDTAGKVLVADYSVITVLWARNVAHLVGIAAWAVWHFRGLPPRPRRFDLQVARGIALLAFSGFLFAALKYLPQAEAVAISFTAPLVILLLAGPVLGERVTLARWIAAGVGFVGMLVVVRPSSGLATIGVVFGLLTLVGNAAFQLITRRMANAEPALVTILWTAIIGTVVSSALLPFAPPTHWPTPGQAALFASFTVTGTACHVLLIEAYRRAPASWIAPFIYCHIIYAALFGWAVFDQFPTPVTLAGIALIGASGAGIALWERARTTRRAA
jgi:drug/metabolite transporter (DMT)-like permease